MQFRSAYVDVDRVVHTIPAVVGRRYYHSTFAIDLLSSLPLDKIMNSAVERGTVLRSLRLLRFVSLFRLLKLFRVLKFSHLLQRIQQRLMLAPQVMQVWFYMFRSTRVGECGLVHAFEVCCIYTRAC